MQPLWRKAWKFLKKLKIELPYDPAIPLLGIYPEKTKTLVQKYTHTSIATLFIIAKTWKQPECPSTNVWIKKMWCMYIYIYIYNGLLTIKNNEIMPFAATWMDLEIIILRQRKTDII